MKPNEAQHSVLAELIAQAAEVACIPLLPGHADALALHARLVLEANATMNLTRIIEPMAMVRLHILDSLLPATLLPRPEGPTLDLGSGAGYPGIPLAILGWSIALCESVQKKAHFLAECVETLQLSVPVIAKRAETVACEAPEQYQAVIARAVSSLASLTELSSPLLRPGGALIALKGDPSEQELHQGRVAARVVGMTETKCMRYRLPGGAEARTIVLYEKKEGATLKLPRRPGMAQRQPLA